MSRFLFVWLVHLLFLRLPVPRTPWLTLRRAVAAGIVLSGLGLLTLTVQTLVTHARITAAALAQGTPAATITPAPTPTASPAPGPDNPLRVSRAMLPASLHAVWQALGNRLTQGGRERLTATGNLRLGNAPAVTCTWQQDLGGRLHLAYQQGGQPRVLTYDGQTVRGNGAAVTPAEYDLVETLALDGAEALLLGQAQGVAGRTVGRRFQDAASGTAYDVFETAPTLNLGAGARSRQKSYCFNATTHLLERVRYLVARASGNGETAVEVRYPVWTTVEGQRLPQRVERWEDNAPVLLLELTSLSLGAGPTGTPDAGAGS